MALVPQDRQVQPCVGEGPCSALAAVIAIYIERESNIYDMMLYIITYNICYIISYHIIVIYYYIIVFIYL